MAKLSRNEVPEQVKANVREYLKRELPTYEMLQVFRASEHLDDWYLYHVIAKTPNGYACWTCWNETTQSLNYGHYNLADERTAREICEEFYHRV